ncbi:hypothetical protein EAI89_08985 [Eubacterium sp. am_0171]|uniref:Putative membrane protein ydgH n=1 Tax=Faecalicatena contorta TaxID=39482 RepID=A0A174HBI8_9FIRM|nr:MULTISPECIES: efflux RND transporter permease subunit [Clostridia]MSC83945.1 MMPL family transporter [Eubacterium sp. BIOML-A1]MSD06311.1 MMPL family transporter [Eubacterium sp. BIOML-A2]RYT20639.1 hypothetical protein EAI89_08985 [Eubacterium sp. am_0171]CUO71641.1 Putative membrane protein ydgH [[Eubacterium] contortum] [Faecalicatena contorta]
MKKFYQWVVNHPSIIITTFAVLFIICALCKQMVSVDYDMNDYLPENSPSTVALDLMDTEFGGGIPNARVMVKNTTVPEALEYKAEIEAVDGVTAVTWLDDAASMEEPLETMDTDMVKNYYKDGNALFSVTIDSEKRMDAVNAIRDLIGEDNAMTGSAVSTAAATQSTVKEISKIAAIAVLFVLLVLAVTTTSWMEPIIVMIGLGLAIMINAGSNLIFGEISFVTNAAGNILQLAVSLDYSVFLLHRFTECRKKTCNTKEAMIEALCMSTSSILSSGLTTVIGFLALCLMKFQIGPDLRRALAKGIAISLLTVFVFMPVLILATYKWIDRFEHKPLFPSFNKFGKLVQKVMIPMVILFFIVLVPAYLASNSNSFYYGASEIFGPGTQLGADTEAIEDIFGKSDTYVLLVPKEGKAAQKDLSDALHDIPQVSGIISYVDTVGMEIPESYLERSVYEKLCSDNYARMVISVDADYEGAETFSLVEKVRDMAEKYDPGEWYLAGEGVSTYDLMDTITADMVKVNLVAIGAVFLVLLLSFHSAALPVILVLSIETAIWINLSIPYFADSTIFYIAYLIISSIQLGATVDYAILFTDRYKEYRETMRKKEAVINTISAVTVSILTSGSVLTVVGFLLGIISTHGLLSQLGYFLGKGTLCSLVVVLFVLPGLLYIFDRTFVKHGGAKTQKRIERVKK